MAGLLGVAQRTVERYVRDQFRTSKEPPGVRPGLGRRLAHGKIVVPTQASSAALVVAGVGGGTRRFRIDDPHVLLADDAESEVWLSDWSTEEDADTFASCLRAYSGSSPGTWACRACRRSPCWAAIGSTA
ncbi:hypothetical protein ACWCYZ_28755 [Streptomyces virginiae]